jgi:hypothetical protein
MLQQDHQKVEKRGATKGERGWEMLRTVNINDSLLNSIEMHRYPETAIKSKGALTCLT